MIGDNRPEALWAEMAAMCVGGVGVWLFQDSLIDEVQYIIDHSDTRLIVGEGQEEVDKFLSIKEKCPKVKRMIWDDPKGMRGYDDPILISLKEVMRLGEELEKKEPGLFEDLVMKGNRRRCLPSLLYLRDNVPSERSPPHPLQHADHGPQPDAGRSLF